MQRVPLSPNTRAPLAQSSALRMPAARLIGCIRRQNPQLRGVWEPLDHIAPLPTPSCWSRSVLHACRFGAAVPKGRRGSGEPAGETQLPESPSRELLSTACWSKRLNPIPWERQLAGISSSGPSQWPREHFKSPAKSRQTFFLCREGARRVSGHREFGEGAKGAAAARQGPRPPAARLG